MICRAGGRSAGGTQYAPPSGCHEKSRWCLLKRPENLTENQVDRLTDLLACNLRTVRAYLLKEDFQRFWTYSSPAWAGK